MKARIQSTHKGCFDIDDRSLKHSEDTMKRTWSELRDALSKELFEYNDTVAALNITFLKQFDEWFKGIGESEMSVPLSKSFHGKILGRGSKLKPSELIKKDSYDRFMPKAEFIKDDNRFSPAGVEWLYLAIGDSEKLIQECAEKECRADIGERFGFCKFKLNTNYNNLRVIDLTIADEMSYDRINKKLYDIEDREYKKSLRYARRYGLISYKLNYKDDGIEKEIAKWILYMYAKMLSENIFVPIATDDKKIEYAPFQTLAMYFISKGYDGIIYSSTVCPKAKNIVLFNKEYATPCGDIQDYIISS